MYVLSAAWFVLRVVALFAFIIVGFVGISYVVGATGGSTSRWLELVAVFFGVSFALFEGVARLVDRLKGQRL